MGQRITYSINRSGKTLKQLLYAEFKGFRSWLLEMEASSRAAFKEAFVETPLLVYCKEGTELKADFDKLEPRLVNELLAMFISNYAWWKGEEDRTFVPVGPCMYKTSYEDSETLVLATKDEILIRLWNMLLKGRSLQGHAVFQTYAEDYTIGFLSPDEQQVLKKRIGYHFGTPINGAPEYSGLSYVLHALPETQSMELISEIE
jgi:hypothetical protein